MHYLYVSQLGHSYSTEEGTKGHRHKTSRAVTQFENVLKAAIIDRRNILTSLKTSGSRPLPPNPAQKAALGKAEATIARITAWLTTEDFVLNPDGSIDWPNSKKKVVYDHQLEAQASTKLSVRQGRLYRGTVPFDTTSMVTHFSGPGHAIYVMSQQGNIHVSSHSIGFRHHSSLLAGGNTAAAGELKTSPKGDLLWLTNKSGHYQPSPIHLNQVIHQFSKLGVPQSYIVWEFSPPPDGKREFASATAYLADVESRDDSPSYELQKLLAYGHALRDDVLNRNDWEWRRDPSLAPGVYKRGTFQMVPHKTVRTWLKGRMGGTSAGQVSLQSGAGR